tara:strand:- start:6223 stop:6477 length:255 start_codon:yes stop_codon:yes gene_type:complete
MEVNIMRDELNEVLGMADKIKVDHQQVADKLKYSYVYIAKIRSGERCNKNTKENQDLMQKIIIAYRKEIEILLTNLNVIYNEIN